MELSLFLAKLFGIYMLLAAPIWATRKSHVQACMKELVASKSLLFFSSFFDLLFGLAIVIGHSLFVDDWRVAITIIGYLLTIRGLFRLAFTATFQKLAFKLVEKAYWVAFTIWLVLGAYLTYNGFRM